VLPDEKSSRCKIRRKVVSRRLTANPNFAFAAAHPEVLESLITLDTHSGAHVMISSKISHSGQRLPWAAREIPQSPAAIELRFALISVPNLPIELGS